MESEIILGPPGTGKTTSLLELVEQELADGTPPDRIGYISFTKRAANEAIERACKKFKLEPKQLPYFRTIHSLCFRQLGLRSNEVLTGKALEDFASHADIEITTGREWADDGILTGYKKGDRILFMENLARVRRISLRQQYEMYHDDLPWDEVERVANALTDYKTHHGYIDYSDMLSRFITEGNDARLQKLFVDETQDLSRLQWEVVALLKRSCNRFVIAGDDDQAIYLWAGADVAQLIDMAGKVRVLGQSYRCPPVIQSMSNGIISRITHRRPKEWKARPGDEGKIDYVRAFEHVDIGEGSVLILVRNVMFMSDIERALKKEGIVFERSNGVSSVKTKSVHAIRTWERLRKSEPVTIDDARRMYEFISTTTASKPGGVAHGFKIKINAYDNGDEGVTMRDLREEWGLLADPEKIWHKALDKFERDATLQKDMSYFLSILKRGGKLGEKPNVRLSTIHSAKGAEANHVVLMKGMAERSYREMIMNPEDERRVWYVAVTRAKERLTVVSSRGNKECPWL